MREVDQALARAYGRRSAPEHADVPPAPHIASANPSPSPPTVPAGYDLAPIAFQWPAMVLTLEREYGERFRRLADALAAARDSQCLKVLLFTSCHRAEGRSTLILTLARALARSTGRALLVDADLTGPMLARLLGLRPSVGLDDVVERGHALSDALIDSPGDHLSILPLRAPVGNPRAFLASPLWSCTMARLRRDFDLVLLDGSPLFAGLSAAAMHRSVDAAILVHNGTLTSPTALLRAREVLAAGGIPLLGLAETFVV